MCNFRDPNLVAFYFYELTHFLDGMKNTLLFLCSTNILVRLPTINMENCLTSKISENVRTHYSQSSREVPPPPRLKTVKQQMRKEPCHVRTSLKGWNWLLLTRVSLENEESNPKNNSQLYNNNFIRSEIKLYKYVLFKKCNQIIDSWN